MAEIQFVRGAIDASDCVANAFELIKRRFGLYLGAGLVTILVISCVPFVNFFLLGPIMGGFSYIVLKKTCETSRSISGCYLKDSKNSSR
ncbi:MAG: hypothetical protein WKF92_11630 [Pyrinomonadaceae bacterium]